MTIDKLDIFNKHQYINLETFRKSGIGVKTPVWFVRDGDALYVRTVKSSGKVKRVRNSGRLRLAPCDMRGGLLGEWQEADAGLVREAGLEKKINQMVTKKYGVMKWMFDFASLMQRRAYETIEIRVR